MATFFERLGAYFIDILIVSMIVSLVCLGLPDKQTNAENSINELNEKLTKNEITKEEYISDYTNLLYDYQKENIVSNIVTVVLTGAYFIGFQYMNKGQTIGKKLLKIKVVDKDSKENPTIIKFIIRSIIVLSIASGILNIIFIYVLNKKNYFIGYGIISSIELLFTFITIILILYKKDKRGLHDILANTTVIKEGK